MHKPHRRRSLTEVLPLELLHVLASNLEDAGDLCSVACTCKTLRSVSASDSLWRSLALARWGGAEDDGFLEEAARAAAGSWRNFFEEKRSSERASGAWKTMCASEQRACVERMRRENQGTGGGMSVVFLVDGSGSVTEEDFACMTGFVSGAAEQMAAADSSVEVGVLQFSNDVRVEVPLGPVADAEAFLASVAGMARMNGGTNIAWSVQRAGQLLKERQQAQRDQQLAAQVQQALPEDAVEQQQQEGEEEVQGVARPPGAVAAQPTGAMAEGAGEAVAAGAGDGAAAPPGGAPPKHTRLLCLLTDGRVDDYQAREAAEMAARMADEQGPLALYALGVGRGVDSRELLRIVGAAGGLHAARRRYYDLNVLDEALW